MSEIGPLRTWVDDAANGRCKLGKQKGPLARSSPSSKYEKAAFARLGRPRPLCKTQYARFASRRAGQLIPGYSQATCDKAKSPVRGAGCECHLVDSACART